MNLSSSAFATPVNAQPSTVQTGSGGFERRLLRRDEVISLLSLSEEKLQKLIDTRQLPALRIAGEERFDSLDLDQLIACYKKTALQRKTA